MDKNTNLRSEISGIAECFARSYEEEKIFEKKDESRIPSRTEIVEIIDEVRRMMFPGFFGHENIGIVSLENFAGNTLARIYEKLVEQISLALDDGERARDFTLRFLRQLPGVQKLLMKDVQAELDGDPAAASKEEIIFSYPGIFAIFVYRVAHILYLMKVPYIPRIMSEYAHSRTGIDINPGAVIGEYFFIDHGTGIVIGETTVIGNHVKIYQGVTLGALSTMKGQALSGVKRHPTIEDNVVIYANTTVLGGETVIGENSVIAGNTFVTSSVPANSKVSAYIPELMLRERKISKSI